MQDCCSLFTPLCSLLPMQDQVELLETLQALELAHRRSEFARARAEALATARYGESGGLWVPFPIQTDTIADSNPSPPPVPCRGEALMHAQAATRDAEAQQLQLSALLQTTLEHLGCAPSPTPTRPGARASLGESRAGVEGSAAGLTLAGLLDASLDPRRQAEAAAAQPQQGTTAQEDGGGGGRARSARHQALRASLEGSLASLARGLHPDGAEAPTEEEEAPALDASRSHFSGFTVHTNDLAPGAPSSRGTRAEPFSLDNGSPSPRARAPGENAPPQAEAPRSSQGWRGIASALRSSVQGGAGGHRSIDPGQGLQDTPLAPAWTPVGPAGGEGRGTHSQAAAAAQRPAPLLLPGDVPAPVGAGSLRGKATTSLVRTGASLASPGFAKAGAMRACDAPAPGPQGGAQDSHPLPLGTFLSPTLEGMARWKGARPGVNPRDHIAAVFRNTEDLDFYHPFSGAGGGGGGFAATSVTGFLLIPLGQEICPRRLCLKGVNICSVARWRGRMRAALDDQSCGATGPQAVEALSWTLCFQSTETSGKHQLNPLPNTNQSQRGCMGSHGLPPTGSTARCPPPMPRPCRMPPRTLRVDGRRRRPGLACRVAASHSKAATCSHLTPSPSMHLASPPWRQNAPNPVMSPSGHMTKCW